MNISDLKPCGDKLLIKPDPIQDMTPSGLYKPKISFVELVWGEVIAISDGFHSQDGNWIELRFKPGDRVMYQRAQLVMLEEFPGYGFLMQAAVVAMEAK